MVLQAKRKKERERGKNKIERKEKKTKTIIFSGESSNDYIMKIHLKDNILSVNNI